MARLARIGPHNWANFAHKWPTRPLFVGEIRMVWPPTIFRQKCQPSGHSRHLREGHLLKSWHPQVDRFETPGSHESQMLSRVAWGWCDLSDLSMSQKIGTTKSAGSVLCFTGIVIFQLEFMGWSWSPIDTVQIRWHVEVLLIDFVHTSKFLGLLLRP